MVKKKSARKSVNKSRTLSTQASIDQRVNAAMVSLQPIRFLSLESTEPGLVHIAVTAIEVISHPVQKAAGEPYLLYVTLRSGQKTAILDTPENRTLLGLPFAPPMTPKMPTPPRRAPYNPRAPRLRPGTLPTQRPSTAPANAEPLVTDEDDATES